MLWKEIKCLDFLDIIVCCILLRNKVYRLFHLLDFNSKESHFEFKLCFGKEIKCLDFFDIIACCILFAVHNINRIITLGNGIKWSILNLEYFRYNFFIQKIIASYIMNHLTNSMYERPD